MEMDFIKDRLTQGLIAGMAGRLPKAVFIYPMYWLHFTKFRFLDFAAVLTFNHLPKGFLETLFAEIIVLVFLGVLGIIFSFLLKAISGKNLFLKGLLYGNSMWFAIYAIMALFRVEYIYPVDTVTAFLNLVAASIWSVGMTWTFLFINKKYGIPN